MKLDFNWIVKSETGMQRGSAKSAILLALENGSTSNEIYLDKVKIWIKAIINNGCVEVDEVDAKFLKNRIIISQQVFDVAKIPIKDYIQKRIDQSQK